MILLMEHLKSQTTFWYSFPKDTNLPKGKALKGWTNTLSNKYYMHSVHLPGLKPADALETTREFDIIFNGPTDLYRRIGPYGGGMIKY